MALADLRLAIMSFPQRWDGATLSLNVLCIPSVDPLAQPIAGAAPAFADHVPKLEAFAIPSLVGFPTSTDPLGIPVPVTIVVPAAPVPPRPSFKALVKQAGSLGITISAPPAASTVQAIRKALPASYLAITGTSPTGNLTTTTDDFGCAIRNQQPGPVKGPPPKRTSWPELISYALRQQVLAARLGLRYELTLPLDQNAFVDGGWIFIRLAADDPWAVAAAGTPGVIRLYAARLPGLDKTPRPVFAAVLFPVDAGGAPTDPAAISEAEAYDSGFTQIVHVHQPTANDIVIGDGSDIPAPTDVGIQIGWDDEQVVTWTNRQLSLLAARKAGTLSAETPLGVLGYRVDVADITGRAPGAMTPLPWESLMFVRSVLPQGFGTFDGELLVEPSSVQMNDSVSEAWLPHYFANWRGGSLSVADDVPNQLLQKPPASSANTPRALTTLLSYGRSYAFRVRLGDLTSGGPWFKEDPQSPGPADIATITFRRMLPPKSLGVDRNPPNTNEPASFTVFRPIISYPEVLYTHLGDSAADRNTIVQHYLTQAAAIPANSDQVAGLPDPDVERVRITVEVRSPAHDVAGPGGTLDGNYRVVYQTERDLPALPAGPTPADPGLLIQIAYVDAPSILDWAPEGWPTSGPLVVPRARDVELRFEPIVRDDPAYFGAVASKGLPTTIAVRAEARDEPALLIRDEQNDEPVRGFFFRRPPGVDAPPVVAQFAQTLRLVNSEGLSLKAPPGVRVAFGASRAIRHALSGDGGTITFAAESEFLRNWIVAIVVDLDRDWTWDGLPSPVSIDRDGEGVGSLTVPRTLGPQAVADPETWDRARTLLVYFDAIDPHEKTASGFPEASRHEWVLKATPAKETGAIIGVAGSPTFVPGHLPEPPQVEIEGTTFKLTLPITIPPKQIPELASVGLALSAYEIGEGYASTQPRRRSLWLELKSPIENLDGDALFARVVGHGADPLLYDAFPSVDQPPEPPLVLDPELITIVTPDDSDDCAGIGAMTQLQPATDSPIRFLLPLPDGIDPDDPELFAFWTYELRVGHACHPHAPHQMWWSRAQGRFGRPLRVNGVQHPAPALYCHAGRLDVPLTSPEAKKSLSPPVLGSKARKIGISSEVLTSIHDLLQAAPISEFRVGNLAQVTAVQTINIIEATAPYSTPVLNGQPLVTPFSVPKTALCFLLYAQVVQTDGSTNRNVLLAHQYGKIFPEQRGDVNRFAITRTQRDRIGRAFFITAEVEQSLHLLGLPTNSPLSVLAVELLPGGTDNDLPKDSKLRPAAAPGPGDPLGSDLAPNGRPQRILRVSPLVPIAPIC